MLLEGSCHCGAVTFSVETKAPYPYMYCYCTICRKTGGGGGYVINLHAENDTLRVEGEQRIKRFNAWMNSERTESSPAQRNFCGECGSALWVWDPRWPELLHPFASAIDTPLPVAPARNHIMLNYTPGWVPVPAADANNECFAEYPEQGLEEWHRSRGLLVE